MTSTDRPRRILTVCLGNYCRSAFAGLVLSVQGAMRWRSDRQD